MGYWNKIALFFALVGSVLAHGGCGLFAGTASMRIEVEVYKGPLSKEPSLQWAEMLGLVRESCHEMRAIQIESNTIGVKTGVFKKKPVTPAFCPDQETNGSLQGMKDDSQDESGRKAEGSPPSDPADGPDQETNDSLQSTKDNSQDGSGRKADGVSDMPRKVVETLGLIHQETDYCRVPLDVFTFILSPLNKILSLMTGVDSSHPDCLILRDISESAEALQVELARLESILSLVLTNAKEIAADNEATPCKECPVETRDTKEEQRTALTNVAKVSAKATAGAFNFAISNIPGIAPTHLVRSAMVRFMVSSSEIGRQLNARADSLLKQLNGLRSQKFPLNAQLRESDATEFVQLYSWLEAHPSYLGGFSTPGSVKNRVKVIRHLFADHYWSNINTVYASGWGKGSMALIKDDIGNWNLKSFDSDPEEVLKAYKNVAIAALETVAKSAKAGFSGGTGVVVDKLLEVATDYFTPRLSPSASVNNQFRLLSDRTAHKLRLLETQVISQREEDARANGAYKKALEILNSMSKENPHFATQEAAVQNVKNSLIAQRMETIQSIEKILSEHSELVDMLAEGGIGH